MSGESPRRAGIAQDRNAEGRAERLELVDGRGPVHVGGGENRVLALFLEQPRELGGGGGLARALQADQHDDGGRMRRHRQAMRRAAQQGHQLVVDDLHHLLPRRQRLEDVLADGLFADALDEGLDDLEVDVGFEEGDPHFAEGLLDVLLRQPAETA